MNKRSIVLALLGTSPFWLSILFLIYGPSYAFSNSNIKIIIRSQDKMTSAINWTTENMTKLSIPPEIKASIDKIEVDEKVIKLEDSGIEVFYREPILPNGPTNSKISVLLLHGMRFSSKTWLELGTLKLIAAMGFKTIAIDIPGYGNSPKAEIGDEFVNSVVNGLKLNKPVVVSPSLSGYYTLPYLVKHYSEMGGYIPVAPQGWETLEKEKPSSNTDDVQRVPQHLREFLPETIPDLSHIKVPALVVYGEHDRKRNSALCSLLPWSNPQEIPDGAHPAYLTNPDLWHQLIYNFLKLASQ